jgi:Protein of unknown function (DUF1592)/Protein of unknown function (DUF1588)/Protein of unknown function (DUF1595)/Protein of unknown function (DUF1585)/Protein of unknown function (DUF1587)
MRVTRYQGLWGAALTALGLAGCHSGGAAGYESTGAQPAPQAVPIRRLTNDEYAAATAALFPGYTLPPASFIPDTKTLNFLNLSTSQSASRVRMEQYEGAAQQIAFGDSQVPQVWTGVVADPTMLTGCDVATGGEVKCAQPYLYGLARRAYRRPLADAEKTALWTLFSNPDGGDYPTRLGLAIEGILISPNFIFRPELGDPNQVVKPGIVQLTPWELATRISFFIRGSAPDDELTAAADANRLSTVADISAHVKRLMALDASKANLVKMHEEWLGIDTVSALTKDPVAFPTFTTSTAVQMGQETRAFITSVMFDQGGTFNDLLLSPYTVGNAAIASFYGAPAPSADPNAFGRIDLDPTQRMGLLTQPSLLATLAKDEVQDLGTSIRRGKFILLQVLCRGVNEPTADIMALFQPLDLTKTARQQATLHENNPVCAACHTAIDPLGLPFEHYDLIGRWRNDDRGMPLDVTGNIDGTTFDGIPDMAQKLAVMPESRSCYMQQWFQFATGKLKGDADQAYMDWLSMKFTPDVKLVDMVVNIVTSDTFRQLKIDPTAGSGS